MRVLLTGAAGFIGGHIADTLDHEVVPLDLATGDDVRDPATLDRLLPGVDAVIHQAAKVGLGVDVADLPGYASVNVCGTAALLAAMARHGVGRLVLAGSMVVYGEGAYDCPHHGGVRPGPRRAADLAAGLFDPRCPVCGSVLAPSVIGEDAPPDPRNAYATTKLAQEHLAANWARETGGTAVSLRYHNVYGPRMPRDTPYAGVASLFLSALLAGRAPRVFEDGAQRRDFVHVRDVARANALALAAGTEGELTAYNIASGVPRTVGELAAALAARTGGPAPVTTGEYRLGDVRHIVASPAKAARELGFRAEIPFTDGMAEFAGR
ncbi:NAD-dependent epimerase/dehydratase family protein [Actinomadura sp. ATCC 31491]|uniref:NAD-dependent epimerase/dehydratase family protein n=1 Tax=Actinomadura luzonensis TaxID=2805427 RepID=A0ABT0FMI3_9ACTN|nr:NAD-dependent epimerase/dehydratase family protein [Actinomadura luzonensis]MCK2213486.1 NAD-dependent epimerase/dehydratase family protein [Actinomadura luzonensis]